jgi:hypothetical protein
MEPIVSPSASTSVGLEQQQAIIPVATPQTPASSVAQPRPPPSADVASTSRIGIGQLWNSRGAASYHGLSYFGHQSAASIMQMESPEYVHPVLWW